MPQETARPGICSACRNANTCTYPVDPRRPVFYCEEFEVDVPAAAGAGAPSSAASTLAPSMNEGGSNAWKGLCSDCANGSTCTFPKTDGGVWHCEEYR
jgi:hypothetical protein